MRTAPPGTEEHEDLVKAMFEELVRKLKVALPDLGRHLGFDLDRRIFTPVPRDIPSWKRLYARRTSVERVNSRLDQVFGFERNTIRGLTKMRLRVGLSLAVMLALTVGSIAQKNPELMRSLVPRPDAKRKAA